MKIKCKDCHGEGLVEFDYWGQNGCQYIIDATCPVCDGEGVIETNEEESTNG